METTLYRVPCEILRRLTTCSNNSNIDIRNLFENSLFNPNDPDNRMISEDQMIEVLTNHPELGPNRWRLINREGPPVTNSY